MEVIFDHDFKNKVMAQSFVDGSVIANDGDILKWRSRWTQELKSWHSPYKCLIDCTHLQITADNDGTKENLSRLFKFFSGLFLRKAVGFSLRPDVGHELLPFPVYSSEEEASAALGIRERVPVAPGDFRSSIQCENHFRQHVVEVSFTAPASIDSPDRLKILREKLTNNLMQWHSPWNLLIDCSVLTINPQLNSEFESMIRYFRGFFLKEVVGYSPRSPGEGYPFKVFRARHKAVALLENEGKISGETANCASKSSK